MNSLMNDLTTLFAPTFLLTLFVLGVLLITYLSNFLIKKYQKYKIPIYIMASFMVVLLLYPFFYLAYSNDALFYLSKAVISIPLLFFIPGYVTYNALVKGGVNLDFSTVLFLQVLTSILFSGWIALTLAELGYFSLFNLLILLIVFIIVLTWRFKVKFSLNSFKKPELNYKSIMFIAVLLIAITLFFHPFPWILGGRDPGVYVNIGVNTAKTGSIVIHDSLLEEMDETTQKSFYQIKTDPKILNEIKYGGKQFPGFYISNKNTGEVTPQFFYLWPTLIAIFYSIFGLKIGLFITPFFALLSILSIYFIGKELFNENVGLISALILSLNFAQIWYARYPSTEIFTQLLIFSGIFTFFLYFKTSNNFFGIISAICFGESFLTRVDTIFLLVPIFLFFVYLWITSKLNRKHLYFIIPFTLLSVHALITALFVSTPYTFDVLRLSFGSFFSLINNRPYVFLIAFILLVSFFALLNPYKKRVVDILSRRQNLLTYFFYICNFLVYIYIIGAFLSGPEREMLSSILIGSPNLVKLSWYMSGFYGIFLAASGFMLLLYKKNHPVTYMFLLIFFIYAAFYLYNARISLDHPWWIRRYLPVVIPSLVVATSYLINKLAEFEIIVRKVPIMKVISAFLLIFLIFSFANTDRLIVNHEEFSGSIEDAKKIADMVPNDGIILYQQQYVGSYTDRMSLPLYYVYDKKMVGVIKTNQEGINQIIKWHDNGIKVYVLDLGNDLENSLSPYYVFVPIGKVNINWGRLDGEYGKFPNYAGITKHSYTLHLLDTKRGI